MGLPHRIEVIADPGLVPGSVILESDRGWLDTSVDTQLAEIERGFADLVRRASMNLARIAKSWSAWRLAGGPAP